MAKLLLSFVTCEQRKDIFQKTLKSLKETDWTDEPMINVDLKFHPNPRRSGTLNSLWSLYNSLSKPFDYLILCEDDVVFNKHLVHNLTNWEPIKYNMFHFGSLFIGHEVHRKIADGQNWQSMSTKFFGCAQAVIFSRPGVHAALDLWDQVPFYEPHDLRYKHIGEKMGFECYYYLPNLVQHQGEPSTMGNPLNFSPTFDPFFRAYV